MSVIGWWKNTTIGTRFDIGRRAVFIGDDEWGNKFYEEKKPSQEGRKRRYVIYNGAAEPSRISPDWHGWMHHTFDKPPTEEPLVKKSFELQHQPNLTGTLLAYKPKGSLWRSDERTKTAGDYEAWDPDA
ncbi:NADH:ubiquinone oxidoreductase subunit NDUFA12 [Hirschia baltica]|uniref:NADH:ubiquinone oxidoreductase 17.2 kD subunit n=1 Tax=Hirschia baltica (strain ATCC 49814 / DSM 5838 / IFAM 1418) TaxID=582402 RepID=C6XKM4_HIRBI|nr:NADH:ubiquinone oxidoreductase subunit NDUFA12 [Hirschia baltica]ACT59591.1 NADH:ubiquinone oxidoreductase 17.2 kD subunit [Hirschia baltica ATCC 49814]